MPHISLTTYTRSEEKDRKLHVGIHQSIPGQPPLMCVRLADMCIYLNTDDARVLAEAMLAELKETAAA